MRHSIFIVIIVLLFGFLNLDAKQKASYIQLVEAYTQRTLPGRRGSPILTSTHFIVIWKGPKSPESLYWRGDGGWQNCVVEKAHLITLKSHNIPQGMDYQVENVELNKIQKGDTLELTPLGDDKSPAPRGVPMTAKNTLFFKSHAKGWISFPITNITRKQDIAMP